MNTKVTITLEKTKDETALFKKALETIVQDEVLVGVPESKGKRKEGVVTNALIAYVQDRGSPAANVPARPFMEPGILKVAERIGELMEGVARAALRGSAAGVRNGLTAVGLVAQSSIRARINEGIAPPLKARTLARRKAAGHTSTKPLVVTGQLRNAINFILRRKKS